jgi:His-Xaa-Ser system protein HxsD
MSAPVSAAVRTGACTKESNEQRTIIVQTSLFPTEVILRAAHRFSGGFHVAIQAVGEGEVEVVLKTKNKNPCEGIEDSFRNELLDESLRAVVARESRLERDLILAHALSRHPVLHAEYESAAAFSDPQGLLTPDQK